MKNSAAAALVALTLIATACAPKPPTPPDEAAIRTAITAQLAKVGAIVSTKDTTIAALFTPDATWVLPDASTFHGRASITAGAKAFFSGFDSATMSAPVLDKLVIVNDSEAVTFSLASYSTVTKGKNSGPRINPFSDLWRKGSDGTWRIAYEVNADGPAPAPSAGH